MYDSKIVEMVKVWKYVEGKYNRGLERRCCKVMGRNVPLPQAHVVLSQQAVTLRGDVSSRVWLYRFCVYESKFVNV
jgi:hypothetical protein